MKPTVSIIVAHANKRVIGGGNAMLWRIKEDFKRFKKLTTGHVIIMGRKTYESIGRPLPNRTSIVVTRDASRVIPGVITVHSLNEAISRARTIEKEEIFIIGGGKIYEQAYPLADKLYITVIKGNYIGDTYFPDYSDFGQVTFREEREIDGIKFTFLEIVKKS